MRIETQHIILNDRDSATTQRVKLCFATWMRRCPLGPGHRRQQWWQSGSCVRLCCRRPRIWWLSARRPSRLRAWQVVLSCAMCKNLCVVACLFWFSCRLCLIGCLCLVTFVPIVFDWCVVYCFLRFSCRLCLLDALLRVSCFCCAGCVWLARRCLFLMVFVSVVFD